MADAEWREKIRHAFAEAGESLNDEQVELVLYSFRRFARLSLNVAHRAKDAPQRTASVDPLKA